METAPIQHRVNELFCFESKDDQVEAIQYLLCDRNQILIVETGFIIFQAAPRGPIHHPGRVEACELNHYALESRRRAGREVEEDGSLAGAFNGDTNTRKNRHEIGAGVYYTHSKQSYQWARH